ncbi:GNAT family N-acetyltransferase [Epibacterium ulvae]|uniref:GNAT family N-acetyltransferase n=1 Tax=Epibacterium ulvae TaxID=1156985 RepID=UPI001BFC1970|nr:GNAT family N-acetyltransferase [Epibacterium ulvae]MBT8155305.1 GNAT family N-acetyltransferase [Epibacterium ulvae]
MWRAATEQDLQWMDAFLRDHIQSSMFLLGNLRDFGLDSDAPYGLKLWVLEQGEGVFAISNSGSILMQAPDASSEVWRAASGLIAGRDISGVLGDMPQVRSFAKAAGLNDADMMLDSDDLGFRLELCDLNVAPRAGDRLIRLADADRSLVEHWRGIYNQEAIGMDPETAATTARDDIAKYVDNDSHRVLVSNGMPIAMTGFNTRLPEVVQIGGVFTPPEHRGHGHARHAVALHLAEAKRDGIERAVLFAANEAAAKAYRAVGFQPAGKFTLMLFQNAQKIRTLYVEART